MAAIDRLLARLDGLRPNGDGRWMSRCPAHSDRSPSLSIRALDDGRVLLNDFGGCDAAEVLAALGLTLEDLYPERLAHHLPSQRERAMEEARGLR